MIFPEICRQTEDCIAPEPYYEYGDERRCWISSEYNEGMERIFVTLAKTAFNELALKRAKRANKNNWQYGIFRCHSSARNSNVRAS